jgi:hypothetical protein
MQGHLYEIGDQVEITCSGERGEVIGRAEYHTGARDVLVRYKAGDGRAVESWWNESAVNPV